MQYDYTGKRDKSFCFDNVFANELTNAEVYNRTIQPLISNVLDGFNVTCFAYGMTGAGKTHTMLGSTAYHDYTNMGLSLQAVNGLYRGMMER